MDTSIIEENIKPSETFQWYPVSFTRNSWKLFSKDTCLACIKYRGMFPISKFIGTVRSQHVEIKLINPKPLSSYSRHENDVIVYSIKKESLNSEWDFKNCEKIEWGSIILSPKKHFEGVYSYWTGFSGPNSIFLPARIVLCNGKELHFRENIRGSDKRSYSLMESNPTGNIRILTITERLRTGEGSFRILNIKENDPDPIMLAILSFAFSEIVFNEIDAHT